MEESIQIIGRVSGISLLEARKKFSFSQLQMEEQGYKVYNPMKMVRSDAKWEAAMRICLDQLLKVDAVAVQPDWNLSRGAGIELVVANALGLQIIWL